MTTRIIVKAGLMLLGGAIALLPQPLSAQTCQAYQPTEPSPEMRSFRLSEWGITLNIPNNYRSMLRSSGHVTFHDPVSFEFIQCLARTGQSGEVPPYPALEIHRGTVARDDLIRTVRRKRPWVDYYSPEYVAVEIGGQPAIQYVYTSEIYQVQILNLSFLAADGRTLITLSGPMQHPIMQNAATTLTIAAPEILEMPEDSTNRDR